MTGKRQFRKPSHPDDTRMSFSEHLEELRRRIILALIGVAVGTLLCFIWNDQVVSFAMRPAYIVLRKYGQEPTLQSLSPPDTFLVWMKIALLCGVVLSSPWVLHQAWQFVAAGLYEHERKSVRRFGLASPLLFIAGVAFMFFIVLPIVLNFFTGFNQRFPMPGPQPTWLEKKLLGPAPPPPEFQAEHAWRLSLLNADPPNPQPGAIWFNQVEGRLKVAAEDHVHQTQMKPMEYTSAVTNQYSVDFYVSFILTLSLAFGAAFQLPIVVIFLAASGIVPAANMAKARRYVFLGIIIAAAILTPQPDVASQILLAIPMVILFEAGLMIARIMTNVRQGGPRQSTSEQSGAA